MQTETQPDNKKGSFSRTIVILRDVLLLTGSISYITGYVVWSIQAHKNNLGLLPLIDSQYFIAGLLPILTLAILVTLVWSVWAIKKLVKIHLDKNARGWKRLLRLALFWFAFFGLLGGIASTIANSRNFLSTAHYVIIGFISICLLVIGFTFLPPIYLSGSLLDLLEKFFLYGSSQKSRKLHRARITGVWKAFSNFFGAYYGILFMLLSIALALSGILYFINVIHPNVYQEFGGSKPRCAQLDIPADKLSENIRQILFENPVDDSAGVIQTKQLLVFYSGNNLLLVRPRNIKSEEVYEIRKDIINSILWCND